MKDRKSRPEESQIQVSRPAPGDTVYRKASEHKSVMLDDADSLADMEDMAWPEWDQTPYNWFNWGGYPGYEYYPPEEIGYAGWGPISRYNQGLPYPDEAAEILLYLKGCSLSGPAIITDCTKEYKYHFAFLAGNVVNVLVFGDADLISPKFSHKNIPKSVMGLATPPESEVFGQDSSAVPDEEQSHYAKQWYDEHLVAEYDKYPPNIIIKPYENAEYGSEIRIKVYTKLVQNNMLYDGWCEKKIKVFCGCRDAVPEIYATGDAVTMGASDSLNMWVNSFDFPNIYAVPPFAWSLIGGVGFSLSKTETNDEYEVNVLSTDATPSGTATVTVTDNCGISDSYDVAYDCCGLGLTPVISGADQVSQSSSITLASTATCAPYTWTIDQTVEADGNGFSIDQSGTSCTLKASGTACGGVVVTVTDDCGQSDTHRVRCPDSGSWVSISDPPETGCGQPASCPDGANDKQIYGYDGDYKYEAQIDIHSGVHSTPCDFSPGDPEYNCDECCAAWVVSSGLFDAGIGTAGCYSSSPGGTCHVVFPNVSSWAIFVTDINRWQWKCP